MKRQFRKELVKPTNQFLHQKKIRETRISSHHEASVLEMLQYNMLSRKMILTGNSIIGMGQLEKCVGFPHIILWNHEAAFKLNDSISCQCCTYWDSINSLVIFEHHVNLQGLAL